MKGLCAGGVREALASGRRNQGCFWLDAARSDDSVRFRVRSADGTSVRRTTGHGKQR